MNRYFAIFNVKETWRGNSKMHSIKDGQFSMAGGNWHGLHTKKVKKKTDLVLLFPIAVHEGITSALTFLKTSAQNLSQYKLHGKITRR